MKTITFLITLFFISMVAYGQSNYEEAISQGNAAFKAGQYKKAMNKYFAAEAFDPSKKKEVKERVNKTFEKIEALRELAETEKKKAEKALRDKLKADSSTQAAIKAREQTQKEKEEVDNNLKLINNTNKALAQKLISLSDSVDATTKAILIDIQDILEGKKSLGQPTVTRGQYYTVSVEQLKTIAGNNSPLLTGLAEWFTKTCYKYGIDTKEIYAHFLAQASYETFGFTTLKEYSTGEIYEGRKELGNINTGDGTRYKGRGIFQIVGRNNYLQLGILRGERDLFINNPELLEQPEYAVWAACELWKIKGLTKIANMPDSDVIAKKINNDVKELTPLEYISVSINGRLNNQDKRKEYYETAKVVLK